MKRFVHEDGTVLLPFLVLGTREFAGKREVACVSAKPGLPIFRARSVVLFKTALGYPVEPEDWVLARPDDPEDRFVWLVKGDLSENGRLTIEGTKACCRQCFEEAWKVESDC